mgnify:CR=1 FL=1
MQSENKVKVLFIAGTGRNGSTLLSYILGEIPGFINCGEVGRFLYNQRVQLRNLPCGCGNMVNECGFWKDILPAIDERTVVMATKMLRVTKLPLLIFPKWKARFSRLAKDVEGPYLSIAGLDKKIIVDASKHPFMALLLSYSPNIELYVLHLIRDPKYVVKSWMRQKKWLSRRRLSSVIAQVYAYNLLPEVFFRQSRYIKINYETFIRFPRSTMQMILEWINIEAEQLPFADDSHVYLHAQHTLAGNPDKLNTGMIEILDKLSKEDKFLSEWLVEILTLPIARRYGYR